MNTEVDWGTPFRLHENDETVTTQRGSLRTGSRFATLSAGNRTFVLPFGQQVLATDGFTAVSDLKPKESAVAFVKKTPLTFGTMEAPNAAFLLGVMAYSYDENYRMIVSSEFSEQDRDQILNAIPLATKELGLTQEWSLYPSFVRVSTTDGRHQWMLTSNLFDHLLEGCSEHGITGGSSSFSVVVKRVTKTTLFSWLRGLLLTGMSESFKNPETLDQLKYFLSKLNLNGLTPYEVSQKITELEDLSYPLFLRDEDWHNVDSIQSINTTASVFQFEDPLWVYPEYGNLTDGGLFCVKS